MRDGACMVSCNSVNKNVLMWNQNTHNKSLMPGWSVFYGLRNDSPANACCRRCASLQKQECAAPYRYCRGLEMALCTWARLYVGKFSDMQNMNIYFHCFIYSLWSGSHLTTWTELICDLGLRPPPIPKQIFWIYNSLFRKTRWSLNPWLNCHIRFIRFNHIWQCIKSNANTCMWCENALSWWSRTFSMCIVILELVVDLYE